MSLRKSLVAWAAFAAAVIAYGTVLGAEGTVGVISADGDPGSARIVDDIAATLSNENIRVRPIVGKGPMWTIDRLATNPTAPEAGIVPSDTLRQAQGRHNSTKAAQSLRYIAKLYDENVYVLARQNIAGLADLTGKRVSFGTRNGRSHVTGAALFDSLKIKVEPVFSEPSSALSMLLRGEIAALVHVAESPARLFFDVNRDDGVRFLPVPFAKVLSQTYLPARLDPADYPLLIPQGEAGRGEPISTVAVPMVLAVFDWAPGTHQHRDLSRFADAFLQSARSLQRTGRAPIWERFDPAAIAPGWRRFTPDRMGTIGEARTERRGTTETTDRHKDNSREQEALFQEFLRWRQQKEKEPLIQEFLQWLRSHNGRAQAPDSAEKFPSPQPSR